MRACFVLLLAVVLVSTRRTAHHLQHSVSILRPEVVNSVFAVGHLADRKLSDGDVGLSAVDLADCDHELGGQIAICARQSRHAPLA